MTVKTWTSGELVTAALTNEFLTNSGLVYVGGGPLSLTATNFQGCFTSTYTDYRIVLDGVGFSAAGDVYVQFLSGATPNATANYFWYMNGFGHNGATQNSSSASNTATYTGINSSVAGTNIGACAFDCYSPTVSTAITYITTTANGYNGVYINRTGGGVLNVTAAFDGIRFLTGTAVTLSGNVNIYGYRKA